MSRHWNCAFIFTWLLTIYHHGKVLAQFDKFTASSGVEYLLSNFSSSYSQATPQCAQSGYQVANFESNTDFEDFLDDLNNGSIPIVTNETMWMNVRTVGTKYFFGRGGVEISNNTWSPGEPNQDCGGSSCCFCISYNSTFNTHSLADTNCDNLFTILCSPIELNETTTTTAVYPTTTSTVLALSTTSEQTTTPVLALSTTSEQTTTPVLALSTTSEQATTPALALSTSEQMAVIYIGLIIGGSLGISCVCSLCWLIINRNRRRRKHSEDVDVEKDEDGDHLDVEDITDDDGDEDDEGKETEERV